VFVLIGPYILLLALLGFLVLGLPFMLAHTSMGALNTLTGIAGALNAVLFVGTALYVLGRQGSTSLRNSLRRPDIGGLLIAVLLPTVIQYAAPAGTFIYDRIHWATYLFATHSPPQPQQYFDISNAFHLLALVSVFAAFAEELVFRGMLLPHFIERFGLYRGIFLIGIAWAAIHFRSDSYSGAAGWILFQLANRIFLCLALNYVLSWLTLRCGSILPASILHAIWNLLNVIPSLSEAFWELEFRFVLVVVAAFVLFRFWPVDEGIKSSIARPETEPEPVV
jgi:membrane protease YdiL (CAAX protease family)